MPVRAAWWWYRSSEFKGSWAGVGVVWAGPRAEAMPRRRGPLPERGAPPGGAAGVGRQDCSWLSPEPPRRRGLIRVRAAGGPL